MLKLKLLGRLPSAHVCLATTLFAKLIGSEGRGNASGPSAYISERDWSQCGAGFVGRIGNHKVFLCGNRIAVFA